MENPGSKGEHILQKQFGSRSRATAFYKNQMLDHLNAKMQHFISQQEMVFIASSDANGECDSSFRAGPPGFIHTINNKTLVLPEYRGNGVMASLGNINENPHIGIFFIDFFEFSVGLHVNGKARIIENKELLSNENISEKLKEDIKGTHSRKPERWIMVKVEEAYIHCSKHIPLLKKVEKKIQWGTDKASQKNGNFFNS